VAQFRQPHYLHSAGREMLETHLPEVTQALLRNDCIRFDLTKIMPPTITDRSPRVGDERFVTIAGRRPTLEHAVARRAEELLPVVRGTNPVGGRGLTMGLMQALGTAEGAPPSR
jgi:hypothetical protein